MDDVDGRRLLALFDKSTEATSTQTCVAGLSLPRG